MSDETRLTNVERSLGGISLAVDGSSWPDTAPLVLTDIDRLPLDDDTKKVLRTIACGIEEAHINLNCIGVCTLFHEPSADEVLRRTIEEMKAASACPMGDNVEALQRSFEIFKGLHVLFQASYFAALRGEHPDPNALIEQIGTYLDAQRTSSDAEDT